jgi:hypothetical protein
MLHISGIDTYYTIYFILQYIFIHITLYILIYISSTSPPLAVLFNLQDVEIPVELDGLFSGLPEETFRVDLSSTDLRKQMAARIQNKT